jgi:hypothetical protein
MGTVITIMNMKGGVGKTTVAAHLAGVSSRFLLGGKPRKVLVIDYDPQFNLSQAFLLPKTYFELEKARKTILSVLLDDDVNLDPYQLQVPGNHSPPKVGDLVNRVPRRQPRVPPRIIRAIKPVIPDRLSRQRWRADDDDGEMVGRLRRAEDVALGFQGLAGVRRQRVVLHVRQVGQPCLRDSQPIGLSSL